MKLFFVFILFFSANNLWANGLTPEQIEAATRLGATTEAASPVNCKNCRKKKLQPVRVQGQKAKRQQAQRPTSNAHLVKDRHGRTPFWAMMAKYRHNPATKNYVGKMLNKLKDNVESHLGTCGKKIRSKSAKKNNRRCYRHFKFGLFEAEASINPAIEAKRKYKSKNHHDYGCGGKAYINSLCAGAPRYKRSANIARCAVGASGAGHILKRSGYINLYTDPRYRITLLQYLRAPSGKPGDEDLSKLPPGTVIVYKGNRRGSRDNRYGDIQVVDYGGNFIADRTSAHARTGENNGLSGAGREVIGIYMKERGI